MLVRFDRLTRQRHDECACLVGRFDGEARRADLHEVDAVVDDDFFDPLSIEECSEARIGVFEDRSLPRTEIVQ